MIRGMYHLGKIYELRFGKKFEYQNPNSKRNYNNIILLQFEIMHEKVNNCKVVLKEFRVDDLPKYCYVKGSPNGGDLTPTTIISKPNTPLDKLVLPLKKQKHPLFVTAYHYLKQNENYNNITNKIKALYQPKEGYLLSMMINEKWVGDFKDIISYTKKNTNKHFYEMQSIGISKAENKCCYCCKSKQDDYRPNSNRTRIETPYFALFR